MHTYKSRIVPFLIPLTYLIVAESKRYGKFNQEAVSFQPRNVTTRNISTPGGGNVRRYEIIEFERSQFVLIYLFNGPWYESYTPRGHGLGPDIRTDMITRTTSFLQI